MLVVADASAFVEYLLGSRLGTRVATTLQDPSVDLHAPALCDVEIVSAIRGLVRTGKLKLRRALEALEDYAELPITRHGHLALLERMLGLRENFSAYDATYVALAERLPASLLTCDEALCRAVRAQLPQLRLAEVMG